MRLTDQGVRALPFSAPQKLYTDDTLAGFGVRVSTRKKSFVLTYGRDRHRITLGHYPTLSLAEAREKARRILRDRELGIEHRPTPTFKSIYDEYLAGREEKRANTRRADRYRLRPFLALAQRRIGEITADELHDILRTLPTVTRAHAFSTLGGLFRYAMKRRHLDRNPLDQLDTPERSASRDRVLSRDELRRAWQTAQAYGYPFGDIVSLLILTAQRRQQIASLRVEWVDFAEKTITFPAEVMKTKQKHVIALTPKVEEILSRKTQCSLYFPSANMTPFAAWSRYTKDFWSDAEIEGAVLHDFRRTWSTVAADHLDVDDRTIAAVLNHRSGTPVERTYNKARYIKRMREAMTAFEGVIHDDQHKPAQDRLR